LRTSGEVVQLVPDLIKIKKSGKGGSPETRSSRAKTVLGIPTKKKNCRENQQKEGEECSPGYSHHVAEKPWQASVGEWPGASNKMGACSGKGPKKHSRALRKRA